MSMNGDSRAGFKKPGRPLVVLLGVLRVAAGLGLIGVLLARTDVPQAARIIGQSNPWLLALAAVWLAVLLLIGVMRWGILLRARGYGLKAGFLVRVYLAANGLNSVLPTALGGDVLRMVYTARNEKRAEAVALVLADRALGLVGLLVLSLAASFVLLAQVARHLVVLNLAALAVLGLGVAVVFIDPAYRLVSGFLNRVAFLRLGPRVVNVIDGFRSFRTEPATLGLGFLLSLILWGAHVSIWYSLGKAVGCATPLLAYLVYVPIVAVATMLPVSVGGVGIRENGFAILMGRAGMPETQAAAIALLFLLLVYLYALVGGIVLIGLRRERPATASAPAESTLPGDPTRGAFRNPESDAR